MNHDADRRARPQPTDIPSVPMKLGDPHGWPAPIWTHPDPPIQAPYRGTHRLDCADGTRYHVQVEIWPDDPNLECTMTLLNLVTGEPREFHFSSAVQSVQELLDYAIVQVLRTV